MDIDLPDPATAVARHRPFSRGLPRVFKIAVVASAGVLTALFLALQIFGVVFWHYASRLINEEIPRPQANVELARLFEQSFGVTLDNDARLLRARLRRGSFRPDGDQWFLVQLPAGGRAAFEAKLRGVATNKEYGPVDIQVNRPGRRDDRDDWSKFPPLGAQVWRAGDDRDEVLILGDRVFFRHIF